MGCYDHDDRYRELPSAATLMRQVADMLPGTRSVVVDRRLEQLLPALQAALPAGTLAGRSLIIVWTGHGMAAGGALRLIVRNTADPTLTGTYQPEALAELAANTGASQILFVLDTCQSGAGILPMLSTLQTITDAAMKSEDVWVGVLAASQSYGKARDGALLLQLRNLLSKGPRTPEERTVWSPYNEFVRGDELLHTLTSEWESDDPQQVLRPATMAQGRDLVPNPCWIASAPNELVAHLLLAARGADPGEEAWYFSGRQGPIAAITARIKERTPGAFVVTGPAGSGKSAILGRVAALSDSRERERMRNAGALVDEFADPGVGSVDANLNVRNMTAEEAIYELGRQLQRPNARTVWALMDWSAQQARAPVLVIDGLDEAGAEARRLAGEVQRLAQVCCVFVATRRFEAGVVDPSQTKTLPQIFAGTGSQVLDLADEDLNDLLDDIRAYARKRLAGTRPDATIGTLADEVALLAMDDEQGGAFLLARALTARLREEPDLSPRSLASSLEDAFEADLNRWPEIERDGRLVKGGARDLIFALAYGTGDGLPARDVWPVVATAVSTCSNTFTEADVHNLIGRYGEYYGRYIVAGSEEGRAVHRLYHRRLIDHLRKGSSFGDERSVNVYRALADLAARQLGTQR